MHKAGKINRKGFPEKSYNCGNNHPTVAIKKYNIVYLLINTYYKYTE